MKMLFFGHFSNPNSTNHSQAEAFERQRIQVERKDFRENRILPDGSFDIVFFSKCNEYGVEMVEKYKGAKRILWYMDALNGNYSEALKEKIKLVELAVFALHDPWKESFKLNSKSLLIEEGFDSEVDYPVKVAQNINVSFIGTLYDKKRKDYYNALNFRILKTDRGNHNVAVGQSKINLNFTNGGTSDRAYKVMAAGGFLLSERWPGCPLVEDRDFVGFSNIEEAKRKIDHYLKNTEERMRIANNGFIAVQQFSRDSWAERICAAL